MIQINGLHKRFANGKIAVNHTTWTAEDGQITGFIGSNGAGKTTTLKMITGVLEPSEGTAILNGCNIKEDSVAFKKLYGFVSDSPDHFLRLKGIEYLNFMADIYGVSQEKRTEIITDLASRFDLTEALSNTILSYSHGMRQKIQIIGALIHEPAIWILDEPLTGLDPQASHELKKMMREHCERGGSVLFSTHVLEVAEKLCDKVVIIQKGSILFEGTLESLKGKYADKESLEEIFLAVTNEGQNA